MTILVVEDGGFVHSPLENHRDKQLSSNQRPHRAHPTLDKGAMPLRTYSSQPFRNVPTR